MTSAVSTSDTLPMSTGAAHYRAICPIVDVLAVAADPKRRPREIDQSAEAIALRARATTRADVEGGV